MGTNCYLKVDPCPACGHKKDLRIGESSMGWTFSFAGHAEPKIRSYQDWMDYITSMSGTSHIEDEYGRTWSLKELIELIDAKRKEPNNHTIFWRERYPWDAPDRNWLDDAGNSFSEGEFS